MPDDIKVTDPGPTTQVDIDARTASRAFPLPAQQVGACVRALVEASSQRNTLNARITSRLHAERPYSTEELAKAMQSWRSNFTTRPLTTLLGRAFGRFPRAVADAKYLTMAELPRAYPRGGEKAEFFRETVTKFLRGSIKWRPLINALAWENVCFGYTAAVWPDSRAWMPIALRQDSLFVPVGSGQEAGSVPYFACRQDLMPNEALDLFTFVEDMQRTLREAGREAVFSWHPDELARAINTAVREDNPAGTTAEESRKLADLRRQIAQTNTLGSGRKVVPLYHVFVTELTGAVSHFIVNRDYKLVFEHLDAYPVMSDVSTFFAFEHGDGTLQGSKGVGRSAYNIAAVQDRSTNDVVDRLHMAGKLFVKAPQAKHRTFNTTMRGGFCLVDPDFEMQPAVKLDAAVEESIALDQFLEAKTDNMVGAVSPRALEGERVTAAAVNLLASRESDRSDDYLGRWLPQVGDLVTGMIRRACTSPLVTDPRALAMRATLKQGGLTDQEIFYLADQPAMTTLAGWTGFDRQNIVVACVEGRGNPVYDQRRLEHAKLSAQVGPGFAETVLAPVNDPTQEAEQVRQQTLENMALVQGFPVPVSLRDAHGVHLGVLMPIVQNAVQEALQNPAAEAVLVGLVAHAKAHVEAADKGDPQVEEFRPVVQQLEQAVVQLQQQAAQAAQAGAPGVPPEAAGAAAPPAAPAPPAI